MAAPPLPHHADGEAWPGSGGSLRLRILGPLRIWRDGTEVDPGPPQQAYLLALLLARAGRPVSVSELIDLLWAEDAPHSAVNLIHKYVGTLRRLLEPALPIRGPGSHLRRHGGGYLFVADRRVLDLAAFRNLVAEAEAAVAGQRRETALECYVDALRLWRGPAGGTVDDDSAARPAFAALDEEFFTACTAATELAISLGRPQRVLRSLRLAASMAPLHEPVQASLVAALGAAGLRAEALSLAGSVRARLADELGIDPGPALRAAHRQVLDQADATTVPGEPTHAQPPGVPVDGLVGRADELAVLRQATEAALAGGSGIVVVEGEPGVGKTRLLEENAAEADRRGALVVWSHCLEGEGTPSMWPWVEAVGAIIDSLPDATREQWLTGDLGRLVTRNDTTGDTSPPPDNRAQFRLFERVVDIVARAAVRRRLVLIMDDLQWADLASLQLFRHLAARLPAGTLLVGALRTHAPGPGSELTRVLAGASRIPGHRRLLLGPLGQDEVTELVRRETGRTPRAETARVIRARTAGNPFFVRELSRLLTAGGGWLTAEDAARGGVPATVRDVVRDRMAGIDDTTTALLQIAALVGREVDVGLLARVADLDAQTCLALLEPVEALGLLGPVPGNPFSVRFAHDLVRESIAVTTPPRRLPRLHLRVADALERTGPGADTAAERLAHHLWAAGPLAAPARTAAALIRAGRRAMTKSAFQAAERQLRAAVRVARAASLAELELSALSQLTMVLGMQAGYVGSPMDVLERAEHLARGLGRELEATSFLFTRFTGYAEGVQITRSGPLAHRLVEQGEASADPVVRVYGRLAWGMHQWEIGNIGEALRYLTLSTRAMTEDPARRADAPLLRDLRLLSAGMLGLMTTLHGDVAAARVLFDSMEADAGDDPYAITFFASFAVIAAAVVGDPRWALRTAERSIAVDPELAFAFLGTYPLMARSWALAMIGQETIGQDPDAAAAELERLITTSLLDPPRSSITTWYAALAELRLASGRTEEAAAALDRADRALDTLGERHSEGLILLLRARLLQARGEPGDVVRAAAERARALSAEREAYLFARRAEQLLNDPPQ